MQRRPILRYWVLFGFWGIVVICFLSFENYPAPGFQEPVKWPERYSATYGFEIMPDHNGQIIVSLVDTTTQAYSLGVRPGMEILGWNTLPVKKKMEAMKVRKYRKTFPLLTDQQIKMLLLPRGRPGEAAEVFFMTPSGNNRGIRLIALKPSP